MKLRGRGKDSNHDSLVDAFKTLGCEVIDTHDTGAGFPDVLVRIDSKWHLVEFKPERAKSGAVRLSRKQVAFHTRFAGMDLHTVSSVREVLDLMQWLAVNRCAFCSVKDDAPF